MELTERTKGVFDPTCSPLINLWGFGFENEREPSESMIRDIRKYVGRENGSVVKKDTCVQLNFSAIGDGFACEIIARYLNSKGINDYMVDIGGEIVAKGKNKTGSSGLSELLGPLST